MLGGLCTVLARKLNAWRSNDLLLKAVRTSGKPTQVISLFWADSDLLSDLWAHTDYPSSSDSPVNSCFHLFHGPSFTFDILFIAQWVWWAEVELVTTAEHTCVWMQGLYLIRLILRSFGNTVSHFTFLRAIWISVSIILYVHVLLQGARNLEAWTLLVHHNQLCVNVSYLIDPVLLCWTWNMWFDH